MADEAPNPFTAAVNAAGQVMAARSATAAAGNTAQAAAMAAAEAARAAQADAAMRAQMASSGSGTLLKIGLPVLAIGAVAVWWFFLRKKG